MHKQVGTSQRQLESKDPRPPFTLCIPLGYAVWKHSVGHRRQRKAGEKSGQDKASPTKVVFINRHAAVPLSRGREPISIHHGSSPPLKTRVPSHRSEGRGCLNLTPK